MASKRKAQQPEPPAETADEHWMRVLPKPPRPFAEQDEDTIFMWMHRCVEAGGIQALMWLYQPGNFPYGRIMRGRCQHLYGRLMREEEERAKWQAEQQAKALAERSRNDASEARRRAGWAA